MSARQRLQAIALEAFKHWDSDRNMKVGKILRALAGEMPGYRADIDALLADLAVQEPLQAKAKQHHLKTWPMFYHDVVCGYKTFEVRRNDRNFQVGDMLILDEWSAEAGYSGRSTARYVSSILEGPAFGLERGFVCMSLSHDSQPAGSASDADRPPVQLGSAA